MEAPATKPPLVTEQKFPPREVGEKEAVVALLSSFHDALDAYFALYAVAVTFLPTEERKEYIYGLVSAGTIFDRRMRDKALCRILYDGAHEASFLLPEAQAQEVMDLLRKVPDPYFIDPEKEREGLISWMERLPEEEPRLVESW